MKNDQIYISDFGFVKIHSGGNDFNFRRKKKERTGSVVGSIRYMAPDVLQAGMRNAQAKVRLYNA